MDPGPSIRSPGWRLLAQAWMAKEPQVPEPSPIALASQCRLLVEECGNRPSDRWRPKGRGQWTYFASPPVAVKHRRMNAACA